MTCRTSNILDSLFNKRFYIPPNQIENHDSTDTAIPFRHIPKNMNYVSEDKSIVVINHDLDDYQHLGITSSSKFPIKRASQLLKSMFADGLGSFLDYDSTKRSSNASNTSVSSLNSSSTKVTFTDENGMKRSKKLKASSVPSISIGWSTTDANKYAANNSTLAGTVKPFIHKAGLPQKILDTIIDLVEMVIEFLPEEHTFNLNKLKKEHGRKWRKWMMKELRMSFGRTDGSAIFFRAEGITIIIPLSIGWHRDILNCLKEFFKSVISVNVKVPIDDTTFPNRDESVLFQWLMMNGCTDHFPCSVILYGRARVGKHCQNMADSYALSKEDACRKLTAHALVSHMKTEVDYKHEVYHNPNFALEWNRHASIDKNSIFTSKMWKRAGAYDKMVSFMLIFVILYYITTILNLYFSLQIHRVSIAHLSIFSLISTST